MTIVPDQGACRDGTHGGSPLPGYTDRDAGSRPCGQHGRRSPTSRFPSRPAHLPVATYTRRVLRERLRVGRGHPRSRTSVRALGFLPGGVDRHERRPGTTPYQRVDGFPASAWQRSRCSEHASITLSNGGRSALRGRPRGRLRSDFKGNHSIGFLYRTPRRFVPLPPAILPQYSTDAVACAYCTVRRGSPEAARVAHSTTAIDRVRRFIGPAEMTESDCTAGPRPARVRDFEGWSGWDRPVLGRSRRGTRSPFRFRRRRASIRAAGRDASLLAPLAHRHPGTNRARTGRDPGAHPPHAGRAPRALGRGSGARALPRAARPGPAVRRPAGRPSGGPRRRARAWRPPRPGAGGSGTRTG